MDTAVTLTIVSFALSFVLTPLFARLFRAAGVIDHPDLQRKLHAEPVPRAGGVPLLLSFLLAYPALTLIPAAVARQVPEIWSLLSLLPAALLIVVIGLIDDVRGLAPRTKLVGEVVAALLAYQAGVRFYGLQGLPYGEVWSLVATVLWILACTNAVNLLDGLDGLAVGFGVLASSALLVSGYLTHDGLLIVAAAPMAGALLAFLRYNFHPARVFLGDSGSLLIGFALGCFGILMSRTAHTPAGVTAPLLLMALPLTDSALTVLRRYLRRRPIFEADRGHVHHRLLEIGLNNKRAVLLLYGVSASTALLALIQRTADPSVSALVIVLSGSAFLALLWNAITRLNYTEVQVAHRLLRSGTFSRSNLNTLLDMAEFERSLARAESLEDCWSAISRISRSLGFVTVRWEVRNAGYRASFGPDTDCWKISIPLSESGDLFLYRDFGCPDKHAPLLTFFDLLRSALPSKLSQFHMSDAALGPGKRVGPSFSASIG